METRRWLFIALLAVACVSLIRAQETSGEISGSSEPSGSGEPSGSSEPPGSGGPSGSSEPSESGGPWGSSEPSGSGGPWGSSEPWGRGEGGVALRIDEPTNDTTITNDTTAENATSTANDTSTEDPERTDIVTKKDLTANDTSTEDPEGTDTVTKKDFDIIGVRMKSYLGRNFNAFCGIPYAEAPIGLRRFKHPVPMTYDGTIDATRCEEVPVCMQIRWHRGENEVIGEEDCLFLNVYEPEAESANMPVIVYFHGGGFFSGSGTFNDAGPQYFMDRDVVLVTVNYRLGPLGFFSLNDREAPGNMGLYDQVLALQWVKKYIRHFHGDRFRVTIMGEGAGGASVHLHLLSSMSRGLFSRAISQSGVALNSWALVKDMVNISRTHAGILGCKKIRDASTMKCMRELDAKKILQYSKGLHAYNTDPLVVYGPMVQEGKSGKDSFLTKRPMELLMQGKFNNVPWLVGCVNSPGFFRAERYLKDKNMLEDMTENFEKNGSLLLELDLSIKDPVKRQEIVKQTKDVYKNFTGSFNGSAVLKMFGDRDFNLGHMLSVAYHALLFHRNLYQYRFDYRGNHSMAENVTLVKPDEVVNEDELIYLLKRPSLFPDFDRTVIEGKRDFQMMRMLTGIWAQFAATGEVKAPYRSKRAAVALTQVPTDTRGTGLFAKLFNMIFSSHRRARREDAATDTRGPGPLSKLFSRIFSSHRRARRDNAVTQSSVDVTKVEHSTIRVRRDAGKRTTSWVRQRVENTTVGSNGVISSEPANRPPRTWEEFLELTWKNKSICWDNYNATRWPAVKRFPDTPGNVAMLPYLSFMKGGNDTPVVYCLRYLNEIDRLNHWLQLPLDEVKLPDVFMNLITTTSAATKVTTVMAMTKPHCPPWLSGQYPWWETTPQWPWETPDYSRDPSERPPWWETTPWWPWETPDYWDPSERPPWWETTPRWPWETPEEPDYGSYTWPQYPKPTEPPPPSFPTVDFSLPPLMTRRPRYPLRVRPKPPSHPSRPRQYFTWPITTTTVPEKAPDAQTPAPRPKPKPKPKPRPKHKPPRPKARSRAPRSCEVWSFSSLLLLLILVVQF